MIIFSYQRYLVRKFMIMYFQLKINIWVCISKILKSYSYFHKLQRIDIHFKYDYKILCFNNLKKFMTMAHISTEGNRWAASTVAENFWYTLQCFIIRYLQLWRVTTIHKEAIHVKFYQLFVKHVERTNFADSKNGLDFTFSVHFIHSIKRKRKELV